MLEARGVEFAYGAVPVLFGVDLEVEAGEIVAVLGTNGAGKSTLLNIIAGLSPPAAGSIKLDGEDVTGVDAGGMVARGVVLVQGGRAVFPDLTVTENLEVGLHSRRLSTIDARRRAAAVLERFPDIAAFGTRRAATLSAGEQQQLAVAKALLAEPRALLIDELSLGLAPLACQQVVGLVRAINAEGTTIVLVEQSLDVAASLAARAVFMEKGAVRFDGPTAELIGRSDLARAVFLGGAEDATTLGKEPSR